MVEIDASGIIRLDRAVFSAEELRGKLSALPKDTSILTRADRTIPFRRFMDVADVLKSLAFTKVGVQTIRRLRGRSG